MKASEKVLELYKNGHIRKEVLSDAIKQASRARAIGNFAKRASLISRRSELFGAVSENMIKKAAIESASNIAKKGIESASDVAKKGIDVVERAPVLAKGIAALLGLSVVSEIGKRIGSAYQQSSAYEQMMRENPEFRDKEELVKKHFDVLKQFSPVLATNPTVAAGHIRQAIEMGDIIPTDTVKNLAQTQKAYRESRGPTLTSFPGDVISGLTGSLGGLLTATGKDPII